MLLSRVVGTQGDTRRTQLSIRGLWGHAGDTRVQLGDTEIRVGDKKGQKWDKNRILRVVVVPLSRNHT